MDLSWTCCDCCLSRDDVQQLPNSEYLCFMCRMGACPDCGDL